MNTPKLRYISGSLLAILAMMVISLPALADSITISGTVNENVRIFGFKNGKVQYHTGSRSREADISVVDAIALNEIPRVGKAEKALASGSASTAVRLFEQSLRSAKGEIRALVQFRLMKAYDAKGDFRNAIKTYYLLAERMPELADFLPLNLPSDEAAVKAAIKEVENYLGRARKNDTKSGLRKLKQALETGATIKAPERSNTSSNTRRPSNSGTTGRPSRPSTGAVMNAGQIRRLEDMLKSKQGAKILTLTYDLQKGMKGNFRVTSADWAAVYFYQGHAYALTGKPELAVASFMRVPIHYEDSRLVPSAMLEAARSYATLVGDDQVKEGRAKQMAEAAKKAAQDRKETKLVNEANKLISSIR